MELHQEFSISQSMEKVWASLDDVPLVADCLPGAKLGESLGNDQYKGSISTKLGPIVAEFVGELEISRDEENKSGVIDAKGFDRRSGTRVKARMTYDLREDSGATVISIASNFSLTGNLAQFARPKLIEDVAQELCRSFANTLTEKLSASSEEEADKIVAQELNAGSLAAKSIWRRFVASLRRLFGFNAQ